MSTLLLIDSLVFNICSSFTVCMSNLTGQKPRGVLHENQIIDIFYENSDYGVNNLIEQQKARSFLAHLTEHVTRIISSPTSPSCIFILLSRESDQCAIRARLGVTGHLSTTPRWGNPAKCLSQWHNK